MKRRNEVTLHIVLSAIFLALGLVLPFLTGQIPEIGSMLLPMHLPVFICGMICGPLYGATIGFITPLLRSLLFSMPVMYPTAFAMSVELLTYGLISGLIYTFVRKQNIFTIYLSLIVAMVAGRLVWGLVDYILLAFNQTALTWDIFISAVLLQAFPGIILQLVFIPILLEVLNKTKVLKFKEKTKDSENTSEIKN